MTQQWGPDQRSSMRIFNFLISNNLHEKFRMSITLLINLLLTLLLIFLLTAFFPISLLMMGFNPYSTCPWKDRLYNQRSHYYLKKITSSSIKKTIKWI